MANLLNKNCGLNKGDKTINGIYSSIFCHKETKRYPSWKKMR